MENCRSANEDDPINSYIKNCTIDIENVPLEIIRQSALIYNHRVDDDYIYGVKLVTKDFKHMFGNEKTPPYEVGKIYHYDEAEYKCSEFHCMCYAHKMGAHGAGLWAYPCFEKSVKIYKNNSLCVPILVKFPLQTTIVMGSYAIKGKVMEVVSIDITPVVQYLK